MVVVIKDVKGWADCTNLNLETSDRMLLQSFLGIQKLLEGKLLKQIESYVTRPEDGWDDRD